jgi:hypothetical protein
MGVEIENFLVTANPSISPENLPCYITLVMRFPLPLFPPRAFLCHFQHLPPDPETELDDLCMQGPRWFRRFNWGV